MKVVPSLVWQGANMASKKASKAFDAGSEVAETSALTHELKRVSVAAIDVLPQMRTAFNDIEQFAALLKREGMRTPITVSEQSNGRFVLVAGERRLRAAKTNEWDSIEAFVCADMSRDSFLTMQWSENESRENLTACERTKAVLSVIEEVGKDRARVVLGGKSPQWIARYAAITTFPPRTRALLDEGACGEIDTLAIVARMESMIDEHVKANAPHDKYTFTRFDECIKEAKKGSLTQRQAKDAISGLTQALRWTIQSHERNLLAQAREAEEAERNENEKKRRNELAKAARSDPEAAAKLAQEKMARKNQRAENAEKNREADYRFRLQQVSGGLHQIQGASKKLLECAIQHESEQRILYLGYAIVRNSFGVLLSTIEPKVRRSILKKLMSELDSGGQLRPTDRTSPPSNWSMH
jgi:ParB/RepB/Spo0J family partition protein